MDLLSHNLLWMLQNTLLSASSVFFGWAMYKAEGKIKLLLVALWILFLPNAAYIFTDVIHFGEHYEKVGPTLQPALILQYALFLLTGVILYVFAVYPAELELRSFEKKVGKIGVILSILGLNFLIAAGVVLGRIERFHSWDLFLQTGSVIEKSILTLTSDYLIFAITFTLSISIVYFSSRLFLTKRS